MMRLHHFFGVSARRAGNDHRVRSVGVDVSLDIYDVSGKLIRGLVVALFVGQQSDSELIFAGIAERRARYDPLK